MGYPIYHSAYTAAQIEASLGKTPRINATTRTWEIWDIATSAYVDTGVSIDTQLFVDPTLTQSGYAADAKVTGDEIADVNNALTEFKNNLKTLDIYDETVAVTTGTLETTETGDIQENVKLQGAYKKGHIYKISFDFNSVTWASNGVQFLQITSYSTNTISSTYLVDSIRTATSAVISNKLEVFYTPTTDTVVMIGCKFFLGAGSQDIDIAVTEVVSDIAEEVDYLLTQSENIMPLVNTVTQNFSGTIDNSGYVTLYVPYEFYKHYTYKLTFKCVLGTESVTNCLRVQTASAQNFGSAHRQDVINNAVAINPLCGVIDDFATGDTINETFTATEGGVYLAFRYYGDSNTNYQINVGVSRIASIQQADSALFGKGVVALNKDVEPYVLQLGREISAQTQNHTYTRLNFLFFSDIHARADLWERICDYMDEYNDIIPFAIHGGDYVSNDLGASDVVDLYGLRKPANGAILNTVGNHDCYPDGSATPTAPIADVYAALYASVDPSADGWNATFGTEAYAMYWYRDDTDAGVRIICLDQYHWTADQATFFTNALNDAITNNYSVVTVTHTPITTAVDDVGSGFYTLDNWTVNDTYSGSMVDIRTAINTFVAGGGQHLINLCGHIHSDQFGELTSDDLLQFRTQMAGAGSTNSALWTDTNRVVGTKTYDCFNIIQIDRNLNMIKLVRIGCNSSDALQPRTTLCWDYVNRRLISNN